MKLSIKYQSNFHHNSLLLKLLHPLTRILISLVLKSALKQEKSNLIQHLKVLWMRSKIIIWKLSPPLPQIHQLSHLLTRILIHFVSTTAFKQQKFEPEPTFENNTNEIKSNNLKYHLHWHEYNNYQFGKTLFVFWTSKTQYHTMDTPPLTGKTTTIHELFFFNVT